MCKIYSRAQTTIVYLGEDCGEGFGAISECVRQLVQFNNISDELDIGEIVKDETKFHWPLVHTQLNVFRAFAQLLSRPWFGKVWVVHEFTLSSNVILTWGQPVYEWKEQTTCPWYGLYLVYLAARDTARRFEYRLRDQAHDKDAFDRGIAGLVTMTEWRANKVLVNPNYVQNLMQCIERSQVVLADRKPYSLPCLAYDSQRFLGPEYNHDMRTTMANYAKKFLLQDGCEEPIHQGTLNLLYDASVAMKIPDQPSWVPDWSRVPSQLCLGRMKQGSKNLPYYNTSRMSKKKTHDLGPFSPKVIGGNMLSLRGWVRDSISNLASGNDWEYIIRTDQVRTLCGGASPTWYTPRGSVRSRGETWDEVTWKTIVGNRKGALSSGSAPPSQWGQAYSKIADILKRLHNSLPDSPEWNEAKREREEFITSEFAIAAEQMVTGRKLCVTHKDHVGLVPNDAQVGDEVCIIPGGAVPFIMRSLGGDEKVLIGEGYIHGVMNGEYWTMTIDDRNGRFNTEIRRIVLK